MTQEYLKSILSYDKKTGIFKWKVNKSSRARIGDIAGTLSNTTGYIQVQIDKKLYRCHRLAWLYEYGTFPNKHIDHKNRIRHDNSITNLVDSSVVENSRNMKLFKNNTSGHAGISYNKKNKRWFSYIWVENKRLNLGQHIEKDNAIIARKKAEIKYGFSKNHGKEIV